MPTLDYSAARKLIIGIDLFLVAAAFFIGYFVRSALHDLYPLKEYIGLLPVILLIWGVLLYNEFELGHSFRIEKILEVLFRVFKVGGVAFIAFGSFLYVFKIDAISRSLTIFIFSLSAAFIGAAKILMIAFLQAGRKNGFNLRRMIIAGTGPRAAQLIDLIHRHPEWGFQIIGLVDVDPEKSGKFVRDYPILGTLRDIPDLIHRNVVDEVIFVVPRSWLGNIEDLMLLCEQEGVNVSVAVDLFRLRHSYVRQADLDGFPLLTFKTTSDKWLHLVVKRGFDIVASGLALLLLAPFFAAVALLIKLTSQGPVFFRQQRCGLHGRLFTLYKFRTMVADAEALQAALLARNEMSGPVFKIDRDPRITPLGWILRKFSVDELPQFWNVLKGDMSLVGPRPPLPSEVNQYDCWHRRRLSMMPGVTCLWQVNGRNKITDFNEWVKLDLEFIDNWSLWLELKILLKTIPAVLFGVGAK